METKLLLNYPVSLTVGKIQKTGKLMGVELELEGRGVGLQDVATKGWRRHEEPSLRGEAVEYTSAAPQPPDEIKKAVEFLFEKFKDHGVRLNNSHRTSTHVHLNFSDQPMKKVVNFFSLFTMLEELLQYYSGEDRKGNLFCLSTREAEGIVQVLARGIRNGNLHEFAGDRFKYGGCNLSSLYKFGTVEIRTMRGADSAAQVNNWIDILNEMYEYSLKMSSPVDLVNDLSHVGAEALLKKIFSPKSVKELMSTFPVIRTLHQSLMEGARIIQVIAYEFEEEFRDDTVKMPDPKKLVKAQAGPIATTFRDNRGLMTHLAIYRPDVGRWTCFPRRDQGPVWLEGASCRDDRNLIYREALGRFVVRYDNGEEIPCRWSKHPNIPDEGNFAPHERRRNEIEEPEDDEDWPDLDDIDD